jgi:PleD family two-component response regulator
MLAVPIRVLPAWHQTVACRALEVLLALAFPVGLVQIRTGYLRRRERELEQQVDARTAELRAVALELRASKAELEHIAYCDALTNLPNRRMFRGTTLRGAAADRPRSFQARQRLARP